MRPLSNRCVAAAAYLVLAAATQASNIEPPDPTKGQINGHIAIVGMPVSNVETVPGGAKFGEYLSPEGCEAHLAPTTDLEKELRFPCGQWFQPPVGNYRIWLEKRDLISEGYGLLTWDNEPFTGRGISMAMGMEPAGQIALSPDVPIAAGQSFRFVHLRPVLKGILRTAFDRRVDASRARKGVAVATGSVFSGIFDRATDDAVALARPVSITAGKTSYSTPALPKSGTDVFVALGRPRPTNNPKEQIAVTLEIGGHVRKPDVFLPSASNIFAVWYGVEGREAAIRVESPTLRLDPTKIVLRPGKVVTLRTKLAMRPSIDVSVHGPADILKDKPLAIELRADTTDEVVQRLEAEVNEQYRFETVEPGRYRVSLMVDDFELRERVDLTSGADERISFDLQPLLVSGTVYHGRDAVPHAGVAFDVGLDVAPKWTRTKADEQGHYEAIFWRAGETLAEIRIPGRDGPPFMELGLDIREPTTVDFHVPNTKFVVNVRDATSGKPISGARVIAGSNYVQNENPARVSQTAITDKDGRAMLPPMRQGGMVIGATAEGYFASKFTEATVTGIDDEGQFEIALQPVGEIIRVRIQNPDGSASAGAQVWAMRTTSGHDGPLWNGVADVDGTLAVPRSVSAAAFLVRPTRGASSAVRRLERDKNEVVWSLGPAAPPLTIHAGRRSRLAVWIDGERVTGVPLAILMGSVEGTDNDGNWSASTLPPKPLRILAWRDAPVGSIESGAYDAVATQVVYPWPRVVELRPVD